MQRGRVESETGAATIGAAAVATAAMAGALVAFGARAGDAFLHINGLAGLLLGGRVSFVTGPHLLATSLGLLLLALGALLWGALCVRLAFALGGRRGGPLRRGRLVAAACLTATLAFCVDALVLPRLAGEPTLAALSIPRLVVVHLLLAGALAVGMRLALPREHSMSDDVVAAPGVYRSGHGG